MLSDFCYIMGLQFFDSVFSKLIFAFGLFFFFCHTTIFVNKKKNIAPQVHFEGTIKNEG